MTRQSIRGHALALLATCSGIVGMGIVFNGVADGSMRELSVGVPLLFMGLWWSGQVLARSILVSRAKHEARATIPTRHETPGG